MKVVIAKKAPAAPASPTTLTDEQLSTRAGELLHDFGHRMGLDDWHIEYNFDPELFVAGHTNYAYHMREAYVQFRTELVRRDGARHLAYVVAHELAHLVLAHMDALRDRMLIGVNSKATSWFLEHWKYEEESAVHRIALLMPGVEKPEASFWWDPFADGNKE